MDVSTLSPDRPDPAGFSAQECRRLRVVAIKSSLEEMVAEALESNCPLGLVDRLGDAVLCLEPILQFIEAGPRVTR